MRTTYRFSDDGQLRDRDGLPLLNQEERARPLAAPMIIGDVDPHLFRGHYIGTRGDQRDLQKRDGWVRYEPTGDAIGMPKQPFDERSDRWGGWLQDTKAKVAERAGLDSKTLETEAKARKAFGSTREKLAAEGRLMKAD